MNEKQTREVFPIAIFIDTNILDALPEELISGDLSALIEDANQVGSRVFIPDVVAREWMEHKIERLLKNLENYQKAKNYIEKYFPPVAGFQLSGEDFRKVPRALVARLRKSGCRLAIPPKATVRSLTWRAVSGMPPFRDGNRGFKDELIVRSMLRLVESGRNYRTYVLVTNDSDFDVESLRKRFGRHEVIFEKVPGLRKGRELLSEKLDEAWKRQRADAENEMRGFLQERWERVSRAVIQEFEERGIGWWIISGFGQKDVPSSSSIRRVFKIAPKAISSLDVGLEDEVTHVIPVTIGVETTLTLEIEENPYLAEVMLEKIGREGRKRRLNDAHPQTTELDVVRTLHSYAVVKRDNNNLLSDLSFVDIRPDYVTFLQKTGEADAISQRE